MKEVGNVRTWKKAGILLILSLMLCVGFVAVRPIKTQAAGVVLKNTREKDKNDVALIKALLEQQKKRGTDISEYLDLNGVYEWSDNKLVGFSMYNLRGVVSIKGFKNLQTLQLLHYGTFTDSRGDITGLLVSDCPKLTYLACVGNKLMKLDVSKLTKLEKLSCGGNKLTELNVRDLPNLESLSCYNNRLTQLDVSKLKKLRWLDCHSNQLTELNVSGLPNLESLDCCINQLTQLNVSGLPNLEDLNCGINNLTELNVNGLTKLRDLDCRNNQLVELDLDKCTSLDWLEADGNVKIPGWPISGLDWVKDKD